MALATCDICEKACVVGNTILLDMPDDKIRCCSASCAIEYLESVEDDENATDAASEEGEDD